MPASPLKVFFMRSRIRGLLNLQTKEKPLNQYHFLNYQFQQVLSPQYKVQCSQFYFHCATPITTLQSNCQHNFAQLRARRHYYFFPKNMSAPYHLFDDQAVVRKFGYTRDERRMFINFKRMNNPPE